MLGPDGFLFGELLADECDVLQAQLAGALGQTQLQRRLVAVESQCGLFG